jgi:hypothetical protein
MRVADPTLGIHPQARAILALLDCEPAFAKYKDGFYDVNISTSAWYNGREKGYALVLSKTRHRERLVITFGECRNSDYIFVDSWLMGYGINPPTVADYPDAAYRARKRFTASQTAEAADYIYQTLKNHYNIQIVEEKTAS